MTALETPHRLVAIEFGTPPPPDEVAFRERMIDGVTMVDVLGREGASVRVARDLAQILRCITELLQSARKAADGDGMICSLFAEGDHERSDLRVARLTIDASLADGAVEAVLEGPGTRIVWRTETGWVVEG